MVVKRMKDKVSPLDSDFMEKPEKVKIKQVLILFVALAIVGYGVAYSMANETIKFIVYNNRMEKIDRIFIKLEANQTIERIFYMKNVSPVDAVTSVNCNTRFINITSNIEKTLLREDELTYIYLNITNLWDRYMEIELYIEGEYEG